MTVLEAVTALEEAVAKVQHSQTFPGALVIILLLTDFLDSLKALTEALMAVLERVTGTAATMEYRSRRPAHRYRSRHLAHRRLP